MPAPNSSAALLALDRLNSGFGSKKFVQFMVVEVSWKIILAYSIYWGVSDSVLLAMVAAAGTAETAGHGMQAWHDKHVNTAKAMTLNGLPTSTVAQEEEKPLDQSAR